MLYLWIMLGSALGGAALLILRLRRKPFGNFSPGRLCSPGDDFRPRHRRKNLIA